MSICELEFEFIHWCTGTVYLNTPQSRWAHSDIKAHYDSLVAADQLKFDPHQMKVVEDLRQLQRQLRGYEPRIPGLLEKVHVDPALQVA